MSLIGASLKLGEKTASHFTYMFQKTKPRKLLTEKNKLKKCYHRNSAGKVRRRQETVFAKKFAKLPKYWEIISEEPEDLQ